MQFSPRGYIILDYFITIFHKICDNYQNLIIDNSCSVDKIPYLILNEIVIIAIAFIIVIDVDTFHIVRYVLDKLLSIMIFVIAIDS